MTGDEQPLEARLGKLLIARGWSLATAESCTGGLVSHIITNAPGSSQYFMGGVVVYSNQSKMLLLNVKESTLIDKGAVSRETVLEMASGVRKLLGTDAGLSLSGIAGPGGGTPEKPVGLVWIGLSGPGYEAAWRYIFQGSRLQVKEQSAQGALQILVNYLIDKKSSDNT